MTLQYRRLPSGTANAAEKNESLAPGLARGAAAPRQGNDSNL